jgi:ATP-dependent DNA ligase
MVRLWHYTAGRPSFQALQHGGTHPQHQVVFYAFDVLHLDGKDLTGEPLSQRRARLPEIVGENATLRLSQQLPGTATEIVKAVRGAGLEGVVAKRKDSTYQPGERSTDWVNIWTPPALQGRMGLLDSGSDCANISGLVMRPSTRALMTVARRGLIN